MFPSGSGPYDAKRLQSESQLPYYNSIIYVLYCITQSLVVVSERALPTLFGNIAQVIGDAYLGQGHSALDLGWPSIGYDIELTRARQHTMTSKNGLHPRLTKC